MADVVFRTIVGECVRQFTVGRNNWLCSDTSKGVDASAMFSMMVEDGKSI